MVCPVCASAQSTSTPCEGCRSSLRPVAPVRVAGHVAEAPFRHAGAAAELVRAVKYRRNLAAAAFLADAMAPLVPADAAAIVPVPRAVARRARYGIDPARVLARGIGRRLGIPVVECLACPLWWPRRAGLDRGHRGAVRFRLLTAAPQPLVLVDDVRTTGATLASAAGALGAHEILLLTATAAGTME